MENVRAFVAASGAVHRRVRGISLLAVQSSLGELQFDVAVNLLVSLRLASEYAAARCNLATKPVADT